jgi:hypothetical protein
MQSFCNGDDLFAHPCPALNGTSRPPHGDAWQGGVSRRIKPKRLFKSFFPVDTLHPPVDLQRGGIIKWNINMVLVTSAVLFAFIYKKAIDGSNKYVVPSRANKYHYPACRWARIFRAKNLAIFHSAKDALGAGYVPCKVCKPPGRD